MHRLLKLALVIVAVSVGAIVSGYAGIGSCTINIAGLAALLGLVFGISIAAICGIVAAIKKIRRFAVRGQ